MLLAQFNPTNGMTPFLWHLNDKKCIRRKNMNLRCFFAKIAAQVDKNGAKLTYPSTNNRLPYTVSKICLHETAIKPTIYIAQQNTETALVFKKKPASGRSEITGKATARVSLCMQAEALYTTKQNPRRLTQARYLPGVQ